MSESHDLVAPYALDALGPDEIAVFEAHLETCDLCRGDLDSLRDTLSSLAADAQVSPPPGLKTTVMASIGARGGEQLARRRHRPTMPAGWIFAAAAAVIAVVFAGLWINSNGRLDDAERILAVYEAPDATTVTLSGVRGDAVFVYSLSLGEGVLAGARLEEPEDGREYELWLIDETGPQPAGTFRPGRSPLVLVEDLAAGQTIAMTVEPAGGVPAPTGDVLFSAGL